MRLVHKFCVVLIKVEMLKNDISRSQICILKRCVLVADLVVFAVLSTLVLTPKLNMF